MATNWYWQERDQERGPVSFRDLALMIREHVLNEDDLVRPHYSQEWQTADRVVGLFYMARRVAAPRPEEAPTVEADAPAAVSRWDARETLHSRGTQSSQNAEQASAARGGSRVEANGALNPDDEELLPAGGCECDASGEVGEPVADGAIAAVIGEAIVDWDRRHVAATAADEPARRGSTVLALLLSPVYRVGAMLGTAANTGLDVCFWIGKVAGLAALCRLLDRMASRQTLSWWFRGGCSIAVAAAVGWGVTTWSHYEVLRFPDPELIKAGKTVFPLFGPCLPVEYTFMLVDVILASAVVGFLGARWLESLAQD